MFECTDKTAREWRVCTGVLCKGITYLSFLVAFSHSTQANGAKNKLLNPMKRNGAIQHYWMLHSESSSIRGGLELTATKNILICLYLAQARYYIGILEIYNKAVYVSSIMLLTKTNRGPRDVWFPSTFNKSNNKMNSYNGACSLLCLKSYSKHCFDLCLR